jgi:hypothetical protein
MSNAAVSRGSQLQSFAAQILQNAADDLAPFLEPVVSYMPTGAVEINALSALRAATTAAFQLQWPCDGYLVGISANARVTSQDLLIAAQTQLLLRVVVDGNTELFTTGTAPGFRPFFQLVGPGGAQGSSYRTRVSFLQATPWQVYVQNVASGTDYTVDISLDYVNTRTPRPAD